MFLLIKRIGTEAGVDKLKRQQLLKFITIGDPVSWKCVMVGDQIDEVTFQDI